MERNFPPCPLTVSRSRFNSASLPLLYDIPRESRFRVFLAGRRRHLRTAPTPPYQLLASPPSGPSQVPSPSIFCCCEVRTLLLPSLCEVPKCELCCSQVLIRPLLLPVRPLLLTVLTVPHFHISGSLLVKSSTGGCDSFTPMSSPVEYPNSSPVDSPSARNEAETQETQGTSQTVEGERELLVGEKRLRSTVWEHFTKIKVNGINKAECNCISEDYEIDEDVLLPQELEA
nr:zinc finger BED domain-containing protein RICESLEEPER 3-like [Ipomoea batatas]